MPILSTVTGSFFAGRRASAYGTAWAPTDLGIDLRMWLNPSDTSTTTFQSGTNALLSITDASGNSGVTININNTPQQGTEDNKEIMEEVKMKDLIFDQNLQSVPYYLLSFFFDFN